MGWKQRWDGERGERGEGAGGGLPGCCEIRVGKHYVRYRAQRRRHRSGFRLAGRGRGEASATAAQELPRQFRRTPCNVKEYQHEHMAELQYGDQKEIPHVNQEFQKNPADIDGQCIPRENGVTGSLGTLSTEDGFPYVKLTERGYDNFADTLKWINAEGMKYGGVMFKVPDQKMSAPQLNASTHRNVPIYNQSLRGYKRKGETLVPGYFQVIVRPEKMPLKQLCRHMQLWGAVHSPEEDKQVTEEQFWSEVEEQEANNHRRRRPYGSDWDAIELNIINLDGLGFLHQKFNVLRRIPEESWIKGIQTPYIYAGTPGTVFGWHVEDYWFHSANYLWDGSPKVWYMVPQGDRLAFERYQELNTHIPRAPCNKCRRRHLLLTTPTALPLDTESRNRFGFSCFKFRQCKGDLMVTWPATYHQGMNLEWNLAEAANFNTIEAQSTVRQFKPCTCTNTDLLIISEEHLALMNV